jgi:arabinofuranosyltransferase
VSVPPAASTARTAARVLVLVLLAATYWIGGRAVQAEINPTRIGTDDANIYYRYARNLAQGLGCVWNPGGERVEGCTSPLWTAVCTAAFLATPAIEAALFAVSVALAALAAWLVALTLARLLQQPAGAGATIAAGLAVAAWIATSPGHVLWLSASLMDTALWSAVIVGAWLAASAFARDPDSRGRQAGLGGAAVALLVTRPEGAVAALWLLAAAAPFARRAGEGFWPCLRRIAVPLAILAVATAAFFVARRVYFGYWLPNTYYAKVDADPWHRLSTGFPYLGRFAAAFPYVTGALAAAAVFVLRRPRSPEASLALAIAGFGAFNVLFVGGDHFEGWRVLQPYWLLVPVPLAASIRRLAPKRAAWPLAALALLSALTLFTNPMRWGRLPEHTGIHISFLIGEVGRLVGSQFNEVFPAAERPVVGVFAAGGFPYVYEGRSLDLLALNDVEMAHATRRRRNLMFGHGAFDAATFFRKRPEILIGIMQPVPIDDPKPQPERIRFAQLDAEETRQFDEIYAPAVLSTDASRAIGVALPVWARRDWLARVAGRLPLKELPPPSK